MDCSINTCTSSFELQSEVIKYAPKSYGVSARSEIIFREVIFTLVRTVVINVLSSLCYSSTSAWSFQRKYISFLLFDDMLIRCFYSHISGAGLHCFHLAQGSFGLLRFKSLTGWINVY